MLWLSDEIKKDFPYSFKEWMNLKGVCYRDQKGRKTYRVQLGNKTYFIKQHQGIGLKEMLKNLSQGKWPVLGAKNEWLAINHLQNNEILVPQVKAYGSHGWNILKQKSFVLLEDIHPAISLEALTAKWLENKPSLHIKRRLIAAVALLAKKMHTACIHHRDFYICHLLLNPQLPIDSHWPTLYLIDLHRAQKRKKIAGYCQIKDLAALYFSSKHLKLSHYDYFYFLKVYHGESLQFVLKHYSTLWKKVKLRGDQLYREHFN